VQVFKGVKKNHVTLRLTKKLEVLNANLIAQTLRNVLYFIILWTVHLNFFFYTGHSQNKGQLSLMLRNCNLR